MNSSKTQHILRANKELISDGNLNNIKELFAKDYTVHSGGRDYKGHDFIKQFIKELHTAIDDIKPNLFTSPIN